MFSINPQVFQHFFCKIPAKVILLLVYITSVNFLSGYVAVWLKFPSLWGNSKIFLDYAMPFGMTWAMAHWPSLVLISIPLLRLPHWNKNQLKRFRQICIGLFVILLYGIIEKIPFALFPAVDLLIAFLFSLVIVPPTYKTNPALTIIMGLLLSMIILSGIYTLYSRWQHQTPTIKEIELMDGLFKLKKIHADNSYRRELIFTIELTQYIPQKDVCVIASEMGESLFKTYPFDKTYDKNANIIFNPKQQENNFISYQLGKVYEDYYKGEIIFGCYLKYR